MGKGKLARKLQEQNVIGPGRAVDTSTLGNGSGSGSGGSTTLQVLTDDR